MEGDQTRVSFKDNWLFFKAKGTIEIISTSPANDDVAFSFVYVKGKLVLYRGIGSNPIRALANLRENYDDKQSHKPELAGKMPEMPDTRTEPRSVRRTKQRRNLFDRPGSK